VVPRGGIEFRSINLKYRHFSTDDFPVYPSMYPPFSAMEGHNHLNKTSLHRLSPSKHIASSGDAIQRVVRRAINRSRSVTACRSRRPPEPISATPLRLPQRLEPSGTAIPPSDHPERLWVRGEQSRSAHLRIFPKNRKRSDRKLGLKIPSREVRHFRKAATLPKSHMLAHGFRDNFPS